LTVLSRENKSFRGSDSRSLRDDEFLFSLEDGNKKPRVAVVYHMFPHYRAAVMRALDGSNEFEFSFFGSFKLYNGIEAMDPHEVRRPRPTDFVTFGAFYWQRDLISLALSRTIDAIIFLGNPNFISAWLAAILARLTGKKVLFWTHGWLKPERTLKSLLRRMFYRLADVVLVYGERAKELGVKSGFPAERIEVIYNSLDFEKALSVRARIVSSQSSRKVDPHRLFRRPENPLIICTARLMPLCRFDLLFEAASIMKERGHPINILLVGDGPIRSDLQHSARGRGLDVHFWGACYDEAVLGELIYRSDVTVSPGKIGLTVIHSLTYGTPAITHSDMDEQMPEAEAIAEGETGLLFEKNNSYDLADTIARWLDTIRDRESVRRACYDMIATKWNPRKQTELIERALRRALTR
jgi:glycosyltransferase involved in cell wall biosynthesis